MDGDRSNRLLAAARSGDAEALSDLFKAHHAELERMVDLRLEPRLRQRVDPADVVQEAWVEVVRRFGEWCEKSSVPFRIWLRLTTLQSMAQVQRRNLAAGKRDAKREVALASSRPSISAVGLADVFVASQTSPSRAAQRVELHQRVLAALGELDELDREVILLRQFENLSNADIAAELDIEPAAARKRFARALLRLKPALAGFADGSAGGYA